MVFSFLIFYNNILLHTVDSLKKNTIDFCLQNTVNLHSEYRDSVIIIIYYHQIIVINIYSIYYLIIFCPISKKLVCTSHYLKNEMFTLRFMFFFAFFLFDYDSVYDSISGCTAGTYRVLTIP